ncbi:MAG: PD40 domain-containing protein [Bacteroidaceae bacterium]|nr:PD40 domain-containing protein [Bacteroidaceae bacterium]
MRYTLYIYIIAVLLLLAGCKPKAVVPSQYSQLQEEANIYPDYANLIVPPNIAPLNFMVCDTLADAFVAHLQGKSQELLVSAGKDGKIQMDMAEWKHMLSCCKGTDISVSIYARRGDRWYCYKPYTLSVAEEPVDAFLSYRLIQPSYELYRQLGIYQRNLTNWDVHTIYENNREFENSVNHCINCHNYRSNSSADMLFHVRSNYGGTVIVQNGKAHKVQMKDSTIITAGVYPSWHPHENLVAFSTNKTGQAFHIYHPEKLEVMDESSDLLLYDVTKNEVSHIIRTPNDLETFPCWSPDGKTLYYCNANVTSLLNPSLPDSTRTQQLMIRYDSIYYNLMSVTFDAKSRQFGEPKLEVDAASEHKSISVPRVSPDSRYVLYTQGDYGQFHIWHKSADLWVKELQTGKCYALTAANSKDAESFHSWSSNGRWIVFASRRMDGNYSRAFLAYFDKNGQAHKAFVIPQEDPEMNVLLLKSFNVPELTKDAVSISTADITKCIYETEAVNAKYIPTAATFRYQKPKAEVGQDAITGASPRNKK